MSELDDRINAILGDPGEMEKISRIAAELMGGAESDASGGVSDTLRRALSSGLGGEKAAVLKAVSPYLAESRRERLERSMRLAQMLRLAGRALREDGGDGGI